MCQLNCLFAAHYWILTGIESAHVVTFVSIAADSLATNWPQFKLKCVHHITHTQRVPATRANSTADANYVGNDLFSFFFRFDLGAVFPVLVSGTRPANAALKMQSSARQSSTQTHRHSNIQTHSQSNARTLGRFAALQSPKCALHAPK